MLCFRGFQAVILSTHFLDIKPSYYPFGPNQCKLLQYQKGRLTFLPLSFNAAVETHTLGCGVESGELQKEQLNFMHVSFPCGTLWRVISSHPMTCGKSGIF